MIFSALIPEIVALLAHYVGVIIVHSRGLLSIFVMGGH